MKKLLSIQLALILLLSSLTSLGPISVAYAQSSLCENGECIENIIHKLEELGSVYSQECLPNEGSKVDLKTYHEENGLSEKCWKLITEINQLESELSAHQTRLEQRLGCESGDCKLEETGNSLNAQITALTKVEENLSCTEPKKVAIRAECPKDMQCVLMASALGAGGYLAEILIPNKTQPKGCHLGDDNCLTQLATGFLKAAITFFEGSWELLKSAKKYSGKKMEEFWNWVKGAEDHTSTSQLAMAKASEDPDVFDMLIKDFSGTMAKIWSAFVGTMKEWLKTDIFCQKWAGAPHFSNCLKPTESFDCIPCKTMATGLCSITGTLVAEVVPSFLTGGLVTAAKYGVNGAVKISKMLKVSSTGMKVIKNSKIAKIASEASNKIDDVLKVSKGLRATKVAVDAAVKAIRKYLLSPTRRKIKESYAILSTAIKKGTPHIAETKLGKMIIFSAKTTKMAGKMIIYPIENPMTTFAFKAGQRSFDKLFKLGAPKLGAKGAVASTLVKNDNEIELLLAQVEEAKIKSTKAKDLVNLEEELLVKVEQKRSELLHEAFAEDNINLDEIIQHLYPELQYGDLAKKLPAEKILAAEKELYLEIQRLPDGPTKKTLTKSYQSHVIQGEARARVVNDNSPTYKKIIDNSLLNEEARFSEAMKLLKRKPASLLEQQNLAKTLKEAHLSAPENGVFEYSWSELREKYRILVDGGFTPDEADILLRSGLAGRPPVRELIKPGETLFSGFAEDIVDGDYLKKRDELLTLIKEKNPQERIGFFQRISEFFSPSGEKAKVITDNLESLYFVDYADSADELNNFLVGSKQITKSDMSKKYNIDAFENFKNARKYLMDENPEMNKETLLEVHKRMMKGGIEGVPSKDLGVIRDGHWFGNVPTSHPIDEATKKIIMDNPYLTWIEKGKVGTEKYWGEIQYPNVDHVKKEGLDIIRKKHPDLVLEIEKYQKDHNSLTVTKKAVTKKLVDAMVDERMEWFNRERTLIGDINSPEKLDQYTNLVAQFQRDLVSIHPLPNGNGRSTREFALSYALMKEGLPPPRIIDTNSDIYRSLDDWKKIIKHGVLASDFLIDDLLERIKFGLPIENSTELITPYTRPPFKMILKGDKKVIEMDGVEYIDPRLYREIIKREIAENPGLKAELKSNPVAAWDKIHLRVEDIFSKNNIYYKHPKNGIERVSLGLVDDDFKLLYGNTSFHNKELFDFELRTWYSDDIIWRGLASKHSEKSESEIIDMFEELTLHNASNAVLKKIGSDDSPEAIRKAALDDFDKYNKDVLGDGLVKMARDHSETGPMYGISYGYSTSKNRDVGKAFAMGAMVVGEYGSHKAPELQALLKSRILVGARRANKDVDLGRLKQVREEFSYKYGRQQEVMGIGASDPDAITIVQTLDSKGEVILSYLRNENNPKEILVIKGDIDPDATPIPSQIVKTIILGQN